MNKKVLLILIIISFLFVSCSTNNTDVMNDDEQIPVNEIEQENTYTLQDIAIFDNKVIAIAEFDEKLVLLKGKANDSKVDFEIITNPEIDLENKKIGLGNHSVFIYDDSKIEFLDDNLKNNGQSYNLTSITFKDLEYKNTYNDKLFYLTQINDKESSIIMNNKNLDSHMDLLVINSTEINTFDISKDYSKIFYTDGKRNKLHLLDKNETINLSENSNIYRFNDNELLELNKTFNDLELNFTKVKIDVKEKIVDTDKKYDYVIKNGIVVDPDKETIKFGYNVGLIGDKISIITKKNINGNNIIDAYGKIVSPGFIDMLSFNPNLTAAKYKIADGVTTNLSMHGCSVNYDSFFSRYESNPTLVNYGGALFAVRLRFEQGLGIRSKPSDEQIRNMTIRAEEEIKKGALGIAFSPEYYPGTTAKEIEEIMEIGKKYGLTTHFHGRYSSLVGEYTSIDTVKEVIGYAKKLDAPVHFMHLHSTGGTGVMEEALKMIHDARDEGYEITYDVYPYTSWATNLKFTRFDGDWQSKFGITYDDLQMAGTNKKLTKEEFEYYRKHGGIVIADAMDEDELRMALRDEISMIGSDSTITSEEPNNHHRGAGTFSRIIGKYIRDENVISFMEGLKKITIKNARHLEDISPALKVRGRLQEGTIADITIFDYDEIIDMSSPEKPATESKGIDYVFVSGKIAKDPEGVNMDIKNGKPIKGIFDENASN